MISGRRHQRTQWWAAKVSLTVILTWISGCNTIQTVPYTEGSPKADDFNLAGQFVEVEIDREYYSDRADCVLLVPIKSPANTASLNRLIEEYFALHIGFRFDRVIFGRSRDRSAARAGLDLSRPEDRALFHLPAGCGYEIALQPFQLRSESVEL